MKSRIVCMLACIMLLALALPSGAFSRADGDGDDSGYYLAPSAANAARMLREGEDSEAARYWETTQGHAPKQYPLKKSAVAMLKNALGTGATPVGRDGIRFQPCEEVPPLKEGETLQKTLDFNLHGTIYTDSPLTSVTAAFVSRADAGGETKTVTFDPAAAVTAYSLVSEEEPVEGKSLDTLFDISKLAAGGYRFTLTATTVAEPNPVTIMSVECAIEKAERIILTQNKFDDNYIEANAFFGGDLSKFMFHYSIKEDRSIATENAWREACIVDSSLGRVHVDAVPYFEQAYEYLKGTYVCVTLENPTSGKITKGRVTPLIKLMPDYASYVPRFQSNLEYVSHHTLGTCIDVNDTLYPNLNIITNHELIGDDVKNCLTYNGILTNDKGVQYYDFTYTGSYPSRVERVPKSIVNYLLYELAFFRAGFFWGYYYETACDAMHFTLSENDPNKHMDSDVGLRKIYEYCGLQAAG